ncbi:unnamed protein product, partial [Ectocarpus fasciculatus]
MPVQQQQTKAHGLLILTQFSYSGWHIAGAIALTGGAADPLIFVLYRECLASVLMYLFVKFQGQKLRIDKEDFARFFFLGVCSFINVVGTVIALGYISPTKYSVMQPSVPVWGSLISAALGYERLTTMKSMGIALAVSGAVLMKMWSTGAEVEDDSKVMIGTLLVLTQCVSMACLLVFQKPMVTKYHPACVTFTYYTVGTIITMLVVLTQWRKFDSSDLSFHHDAFVWIALVYVTIFATLFAYNAIGWAVVRLSPGVVTLYSTLQPVGTVFLSFLVWGRYPTTPEIVGGTLVALGLA